MEIVPPAGDAATHELAVVLEVHGIERDITVGGTDEPDTVDHGPPLLRRGHELRHGVVAHRHVVEVEAEMRALFRQEVQELVAGDRLDVVPGVADGGAEDDAVALQKLHGLHHGVVVAVAPAGVVRLRRALDGHEEGQVPQLHDLLAKLLRDERGIRIRGKETVAVLFGGTR